MTHFWNDETHDVGDTKDLVFCEDQFDNKAENQQNHQSFYKGDFENRKSKERKHKHHFQSSRDYSGEKISASRNRQADEVDCSPCSNDNFNLDELLAESERQIKLRWSALADIKKDFYVESSIISNMSKIEADEWKKKSNNIIIEDLSDLNRKLLNPIKTFQDAFQHYPDILSQIQKQGFEKPSPIQCQMWPLIMKGYNVIGIAQTGTGKTLGFLLPALLHIEFQTTPRSERCGPSAVILTPTRELALQIEKEINKYSFKGIRCVCVYGGGNRKQQIECVSKGYEIVVATPGRFNDLLDCKYLKLTDVTYFVLDEADRMLDMGFEPQVSKILIDIRPDRQTVMTSATWPKGVEQMAARYVTDPFRVSIGSLDLTAAHTVEQTIEVLREDEKTDRLFKLLDEMSDEDKLIVFTSTKSMCDALIHQIRDRNYSKCAILHGGLDQEDRVSSLRSFEQSEVTVLIATDLASRGLDVKDITHVVNYDFPQNLEEYVHRVGRTGRAGRTGKSVSFFTRRNARNARGLIKILVESEQVVSDEITRMAEKFEAGRDVGCDRSNYRDSNQRKYQGDRRGGYQGNRRGGYQGDSRGGYQGDRRVGYQGDRRGGYQGDRRGGYQGDRRGGYQGDRRGGYQGDSRGGYQGDRRGGYQGDRRGGYQGDSRGGYQGDRRGGYQGDRRGGYQGDSRGGYQGDSRGGYRTNNRRGRNENF